MYRRKTVTVYFPCRNEASHLSTILKRVPNFVDEVIMVSNRSTDNTYETAKSLGITALQDDREKGGIGYGFAHMTGIAQAHGDIIATGDADGTYPIENLSAVIDFLLDNEIDFVSCNRYPMKEETRIPLMLQVGVKILNWEVLLLYGVNIKDILSGMWVLKKEIKNDLHLTEGDWNLSPQIKLNARLNPNLKFTEYSITQQQRLGQTKQNYFKTGLSHLFWIAKNRFSQPDHE